MLRLVRRDHLHRQGIPEPTSPGPRSQGQAKPTTTADRATSRFSRSMASSVAEVESAIAYDNAKCFTPKRLATTSSGYRPLAARFITGCRQLVCTWMALYSFIGKAGPARRMRLTRRPSSGRRGTDRGKKDGFRQLTRTIARCVSISSGPPPRAETESPFSTDQSAAAGISSRWTLSTRAAFTNDCSWA